MADWKITATTTYCDAVESNVTLMVYKDGLTGCSGHRKYGKGLTEERAKILEKKRRKLGRDLKCGGLECSQVKAFRDQLFDEESGNK